MKFNHSEEVILAYKRIVFLQRAPSGKSKSYKLESLGLERERRCYRRIVCQSALRTDDGLNHE